MGDEPAQPAAVAAASPEAAAQPAAVAEPVLTPRQKLVLQYLDLIAPDSKNFDRVAAKKLWLANPILRQTFSEGNHS